jgi:1,4-dihydroxy-2-naphthoate octaprenyltransferase
MDFRKFLNIVKLGRLIAHSAFLVYLLGALFAVINDASFYVVKFVLGYGILFTGILAAVYTNNYHDVRIDKYAVHTFFSGGSGILIEHPELMKTTAYVAASLYGISIALGFVGMVLFSYPVTFFLYVLGGNVLGWCYTAPPLKLVYRGFGEIVTMIGAGFIIPGLGYFVFKGTIDWSFVLFFIPLMFSGLALSFYLEIPDKDADTHGPKKTFVVRRGESAGFIVAVGSLCVSTLCYVLLGLFPVISGALNYWFIALLSVIPIVVGLWSLWRYRADTTKVMKIVFRASACVFAVYILIDIYVMYVILT